jgi:hypothetical protein
VGEEYRSLISSCSYIHSPVTSSLLDPNVLKLLIHVCVCVCIYIHFKFVFDGSKYSTCYCKDFHKLSR